MLATSTHDTKRSEDVRARIDVLSELPGEWRTPARAGAASTAAASARWTASAPVDATTRYLLYQTLLGHLAVRSRSTPTRSGVRARIQAYMLKALREAKVRHELVNVNAAYEEGVRQFVAALLAGAGAQRFSRTCSRARKWRGSGLNASQPW